MTPFYVHLTEMIATDDYFMRAVQCAIFIYISKQAAIRYYSSIMNDVYEVHNRCIHLLID